MTDAVKGTDRYDRKIKKNKKYKSKKAYEAFKKTARARKLTAEVSARVHSELAERIDTLTQQKNQYMRCAQACRRELQLSQTEVQTLQHYVEQL